MYELGISATILTLVCLELLSIVFKKVGMKSSLIEFSTDNKETLNKLSEKFHSKNFLLVSYQMNEKIVGNRSVYHVSMVIKSKKSNEEGAILAQLQEFEDVTIHRIE